MPTDPTRDEQFSHGAQSDHSDAPRCRLCGDTIPKRRIDEDDGTKFCSSGCEDVHRTLPGQPSDDESAPDGEPASDTDPRTSPSNTAQRTESLFLTVDGMHSSTCEAFLESIATSVDGVVDAEASYVTESVRVEYEPPDELLDADRSEASTEQFESPHLDRLTAELVEELSVLGYTATPRETGAVDSEPGTDAAAELLGSAHESTGVDDVIGYRYALGVVFASFLMVPYLVVFYPAHVADLLGMQFSLVSGGSEAILVLPTFLILTLVVVLFTGAPVLRDAYVALKLRKPNTGLLVTMTAVSAYLYGSAAFVSGESGVYYDLTVVVVAVVTAAMFYESLVKRRAADALTELTVSRVSQARRYEPDGSTTTVDVETLEPGDRVLIPEGERVPVDGTLVEGDCTVDEAVVTGESAPVRKQAGKTLVGGSLLTNGAAVLEVGENATSSIDQLTTAVWGFQSAAHGAQRRANELAGRVVPVLAVAGIAVAAVALARGNSASAAIVAVLTVPLAGSPWVLGFATPLSTATSIEAALDRGVAVFDETVFERLRNVDTVVFDKTGTLTTGQMEVRSADASPALLAGVAALERRASHPAAKAIVAAYGDDGQRTGSDRTGNGEQTVESFTSHATGVEGVVNGTRLLVGTLDLFADRGWDVTDTIAEQATAASESGQIPVVVGDNGGAEGLVLVGDEPREGWEATLTNLQDRGLETVVLTGDDPAAAEAFTESSHVDYVFAAVPPAGKAATVRRLQNDGRVAMVGDGTNDAPALAAADLGLSLGSGTALAADAADLALVDDTLSTVGTAFELSATAARRRRQNGAAALLYNAVAIPLALVGMLNPLLAMGGAILACGLVGVNAFRGYGSSS